MQNRRVVMATFGSLGDLHPYMAIAIELKARGCQPEIATQEIYRDKVTAAGIRFHSVGPDIGEGEDGAALMARVNDQDKGPEYLVRQFILPRLRDTYEKTAAAVKGADMLITNPLTMAAQLVAEKQAPQVKWLSAVLAPGVIWSAYDPPLHTPLQGFRRFERLGPLVFRFLIWMMKKRVTAWTRPWHEFRRQLGLPRTTGNPLFNGQFSPRLTLAMFSPLFAPPRPDWPPNTRVTGFPIYDRHNGADGLSPRLAAFLADGEPPLVFTLGSAAVLSAESFYTESAMAAKQLGRRAVLLVGPDQRNHPPMPLPEGIIAEEYAPFSQLFPHAAATIHSGGIGTTAQALRAGRPMLLVPFNGFDQAGNADLAARLGVSRALPRKQYNARTAAEQISELLRHDCYAKSASAIGKALAKEDGVAAACDVIEAELQASPAPSRR